MVAAANATSAYYKSMGHVLDSSDTSRIYKEHDNSLKNLLIIAPKSNIGYKKQRQLKMRLNRSFSCFYIRQGHIFTY